MEVPESLVDGTVVSSEGRDLAVIREVRNGTAFVEPLSSLSNAARADLGWGGDDRDHYRLDDARIDAVTNDTVRLDDP